MNDDTVSILIIVACVVMSAYFSATETAFSSINRIRIKNMAEKGDKRAQLVLRMSENYDSLLSTILIGNNIVNIACASLATLLFVDWLGSDAGPSVSTAVTTIVVLIFGEVSPKSIAKESPESFAKFSAPLLRVLMVVLTPFNFLFRLWKKLLSLIFHSSDSQAVTEEELLTIVDEAEQEGGIDTQEGSLIRNAIEFTETQAIDVLTPRIDLTAVSVDDSKEDIAAVFAETGYSRIPVYRDSIDHIIGILYQKDFHNYVYHTDRDIASIIRPAIYVTENKLIGELLQDLQKNKSHLAVVMDEFGGTVGIVTMEDILEELVGEIWDEHDEVVEEIKQTGEQEYEVLGNTNVQKLFEMLDIDKELDVVTVSGWVMDELARIPEVGDTFQYENVSVRVLAMDGKRVEKIQVIVTPEPQEEEK
ncbi:HlyC/CorC family transporter [Subdoligranulum sp. DSM 109015]|uniref:HlyC/CorC family transporter n=1 Tax=Gemmiger gallinarum TaxID=2779354 RepID=A0ABR9R1T3_9FIRM|nr:hemolysin family protein [Gemmiger gallinarum]MBE5037113.1 HlyC/CorC family transporter [Gemmiger gallinarum]